MGRNLVLCLDGTGSQLRAKGNTNVVLLYQMLDLANPAEQIAYYDPGVGTFAAAGAWSPVARAISRLGGLAFGAGMRHNLGEAYTWLMTNWRPGDEVFVFGFSRGAYNARALVGMLRSIGLLRPGSENLVPYAVASYARKSYEKSADLDEIHKMSAIFAQQVNGKSTVEVKYVGLWDAVKATGFLRWEVRWPYTRQLPNALRIRHAVSIDERRAPFKEYLVDGRKGSALEEVWFAGVHSDVGGTFTDDDSLARIALKWVLEGAVAEGLLVKFPAYAKARASVTTANAAGLAHRRGPAWVLLGSRRRKIPARANVHSSVRERSDLVGGYQAPSNITWVDSKWADPPAPNAMG